MVRTRVRWARLLGILVLAALAVALLGQAVIAATGRDGGPVSGTYVVRRGDTLWGIARRIVGGRGDPRPLVDRLARANEISGGLIHPGQMLVIPP